MPTPKKPRHQKTHDDTQKPLYGYRTAGNTKKPLGLLAPPGRPWKTFFSTPKNRQLKQNLWISYRIDVLFQMNQKAICADMDFHKA